MLLFVMDNCIVDKLRFSTVGGIEYNVFSLFKSNPDEIDDWVFLSAPKKIMMDRATFDSLKGNRIIWVRNHIDKTICEVIKMSNTLQKKKDDIRNKK